MVVRLTIYTVNAVKVCLFYYLQSVTDSCCDMFSLVSHINHCQYHCRIHTRSQHPRSHILNTYNTIIKNNIILCIAHYIQNYKYAVIFHTHYNFFHNCNAFSAVSFILTKIFTTIILEKSLQFCMLFVRTLILRGKQIHKFQLSASNHVQTIHAAPDITPNSAFSFVILLFTNI